MRKSHFLISNQIHFIKYIKNKLRRTEFLLAKNSSAITDQGWRLMVLAEVASPALGRGGEVSGNMTQDHKDTFYECLNSLKSRELKGMGTTPPKSGGLYWFNAMLAKHFVMQSCPLKHL
jgi:hypothetical protein